MKPNPQTHIGISYYSRHSSSVENTLEEIYDEKLIVESEKNEPEAWAAMEWIIPTGIGAYIAKPYFEGFLQEAGKDHYVKVKAWLKKLARYARNFSAKLVTGSDSTEKVSSQYNQSLIFSLFIQTKSGKSIKLLFDNDLTTDDWEEAIDKLLDYAVESYQKGINDELSNKTAHLKPKSNSRFIYVLIDKESKELMFHDDDTLIAIQRR